ncbi:amidohydrolase [Agrobacterium sp. a22-2]|uniref:amidohydrolase n=1 Tax=Agrobacterium sp. a22-2 TaxID=2283840 RepID=UPI0014450E74|nr:amidohydrolase [Agrobacterium sp. a22-2]NKN38312.1 amidohydrolase [Agrobacterium sp. a22-2]
MAQHADIIIRNAKLLTMDETAPHAEAIALSGNTILSIGTDAEIDSLAGPSTRVIDAKGATVMPGINEAHMHIFMGSLSLQQLSLYGVRGFEAMSEAIKAYAAANPDEPVLLAQSADYTILGAGEEVTRHHLDQILPDRPFLMYAPDHHTAWANTAALKLADLLNGRDVGVGNEVVMGDDGLATGELRETNAISPVVQLASTGGREGLGILTGGDPDNVTPEQRAGDRAMLKRGLDYCASEGITSVQNFDGNLYQLELMEELLQAGELPVRIRIPFHMKNFMDIGMLETAASWKQRFASDMLRGDFVKVFMDGVIDSQTAYMLEGYADRPDFCCEPLFTPQAWEAVAVKADSLGLQIAVHAIGDAAVRQTLDGYQAAAKANGARDSRHRIEHIEIIDPSDVPRFAELGVVASMQPVHVPGGSCFPLEPTIHRLGEARFPYAYAWRTMKDAGARLVFATDWPISPVSPFGCIQNALTRKPWKDGDPDQRMTLSESLHAYTAEGAWVEFMEDRKGQLKPGYLADIVMLNQDIEACPLDKVADVKPVLTICDGRITYEAA